MKKNRKKGADTEMGLLGVGLAAAILGGGYWIWQRQQGGGAMPGLGGAADGGTGTGTTGTTTPHPDSLFGVNAGRVYPVRPLVIGGGTTVLAGGGTTTPTTSYDATNNSGTSAGGVSLGGGRYDLGFQVRQ